MLPELATLLDLQSLDVRVVGLDRALAAIPETLAGIDAEIEKARGVLAAVQTELQHSEKERRRTEGQLADAEALAEKYADQLTRARTNEEYSGLQAQIRATKRRISDIEDRVLELMDRGDELTGALAEQKIAFRRIRAELEARKEAVRREARARKTARDRVLAQRNERAGGLPETVLSRYERIRSVRGRGLARAVNEICEACRVSLRPQLFEEVRSDQGIFSCESCGRLLYFQPPVESA